MYEVEVVESTGERQVFANRLGKAPLVVLAFVLGSALLVVLGSEVVDLSCSRKGDAECVIGSASLIKGSSTRSIPLAEIRTMTAEWAEFRPGAQRVMISRTIRSGGW